jgi:hypothetical protein
MLSTIDGGGLGVRTVRPNADGVFPQLLPGVIRNFYGKVAMGNGAEWHIGAFRTLDGIFVGVVGAGARLFTGPCGEDTDAIVGENLPWDDAACLADLINDQFSGPTRPRLGRYEARFCDAGGLDEDY